MVYARDCKSLHVGSIPTGVSIIMTWRTPDFVRITHLATNEQAQVEPSNLKGRGWRWARELALSIVRAKVNYAHTRTESIVRDYDLIDDETNTLHILDGNIPLREKK